MYTMGHLFDIINYIYVCLELFLPALYHLLQILTTAT